MYRELDEIEEFYSSKFNMLIEEFILMQAKYLQKQEKDRLLKLIPNEAKGNNSDDDEPDIQDETLFISPLTGQPI